MPPRNGELQNHVQCLRCDDPCPMTRMSVACARLRENEQQVGNLNGGPDEERQAGNAREEDDKAHAGARVAHPVARRHSVEALLP